jgi:hypothetical protein
VSKANTTFQPKTSPKYLLMGLCQTKTNNLLINFID